MERLFAAIESQPEADEKEAVVARLRSPATKLDVAHAMVIQADLNTSLIAVLLDLSSGRDPAPGQLLHLANLQRDFGTVMIEFLETLVPDDQS